ncbi:hypothetical protein PHYPSEUDO_005153 [Phytophthora pseudosyringae]|uniref:TKL protein kinase n=1 Tax=Phytophthora pseudosyringae TaxID=221518 RepID=A0A8T1VPM0_9STRA|nr:hypothetical protein PHYPSEUDO_005153 [Phytophthora pseudosyringae]
MALLPCRSLVVISLLFLSGLSFTCAAVSKAVAFYADSTCSGAPLSAQVSNSSSSCTPQSCTRVEFGANTFYYSVTCMGIDADTHEFIAAAFAETRHIVMDQFRRENCSTYTQTHALQDLNDCVPFAVDSISLAANASTIATILKDGSVNVQFFPATNCSITAQSTSSPNKTGVAIHTCYQASRFYISTNTSIDTSNVFSSSNSRSDQVGTSSSSRVNVDPQADAESSGQSLRGATFISAILIAAALILGVVCFVAWKWRSTKRKLQLARNTEQNDSVAMLEPDDVVYLSKPVSGPIFLPQSSSTCSTSREQITTRSFAPALSSFGSSHQRSDRTFVPGLSTGSTFPGNTTMNQPTARPTASEALYKLHTILADDVVKSGIVID